MSIIILFCMIFLHIIADFNLQGILAKFKQKSWWESQPDYELMHRNDYKISLVLHAFSWSFMIHIPLFIVLTIAYTEGESFGVLTLLITVLGNAWLHAVIDDWKANYQIISLMTDQIIHLIQIFVVWAVFFRSI